MALGAQSQQSCALHQLCCPSVVYRCQGKRADWRRGTDRGLCPFSRQPQDGEHWQPVLRAPAPRPSPAVDEEQWSFSYVCRRKRKKYPQRQPQHSQVGKAPENYPAGNNGTPDNRFCSKQASAKVHACIGGSRPIRCASMSVREEARNINCTLKEVICFHVFKGCCQSLCSSETNSKQVFQESECDLNSI